MKRQRTPIRVIIIIAITVVLAATSIYAGAPSAVPGKVAYAPAVVQTDECAACASAANGTPRCVDFESLSAGLTYHVGDVFVDSGAVITTLPFAWSNGTVTPDGSGEIVTTGWAQGSGNELRANNVTYEFDWNGPLAGLSFRFGEYGGNLNLELNGAFRNFENMDELHGQTIAGVTVHVVNGSGQDAGHVRLDGPINGFRIGGQELWLDDVCPDGRCIDFEDLPPQVPQSVGSLLLDSGHELTVEPFIWPNGTEFFDGYVRADISQKSGGSGLDVQCNNARISVTFQPPWPGLSADVADYGGNLNLRINGDIRNFSDWADLHGQLVGGARVLIGGTPQNQPGRLFIVGEVIDLAIGGQELWIDNLCPLSECIEFEELPAGASYVVGDTFIDSSTMLHIMPFVWSDGTPTSSGYAQVSSNGYAGGNGQDLWLNNVSLRPDLPPIGGLTLLFGEYGGNVNLRVNGILRNVPDLRVLDGTTVAGVQISVINGHGNDRGRLTLHGEITSFEIGGQELWIDTICTSPITYDVYLPLVLNPQD